MEEGIIMPQITFREVTNDNFKAIRKLSSTLTPEQQKCVADNASSLAQAYLNQADAWPRAVYLDETPIGFIMLHLHPEEMPEEDKPALYLWRFMIGGEYQGKGYGKKVMDMLVEKCRAEGKKTLYLSCDTDGPMPYRFYINYGCVDTGKRDDDEQVLKIDIK